MADETNREQGSNEYEIRLLRQRTHKLNSTLSALVHRMDNNDRILSDLVTTVGELDTTVSDMAKADEIALEVSRRMKHDRRVYFTVTQKLGGLLLIAIAVVDFVRGFTG